MKPRHQILREVRTRLSIGRARLKLAAGLKSGGFFIPYKYAAQVVQPEAPYPALERTFAENLEAFIQTLEEMASFIPVFEDFGRDARDPVWARSMFPAFDGGAAYTIVRTRRPARILEIGSGNSTRFLARAVRDGGFDCDFTCIDPAPRMPVEQLGVRWIPRVLSEDDADLCAGFEPNDILFIDSSHIMLPGTDVDIQFNRIFPLLPAGVLVHVHDIFLPYNYPPVLRRWGYSEQNALVGWIASGFFDVILPNYYLQRRHGDIVAARLGRFARFGGTGAGSIWLRRSQRSVF